MSGAEHHSSPAVSIAIVNYETSAEVRRCVASLGAQSVPLEVTVVDNPSPAGDLRHLLPLDGMVLPPPARGSIRILSSGENVGYGRGCNLALSGASAPFVCVLNPDTVLPPGALDRWIGIFQREQAKPASRPLGLLAPRLLNENGREQRSTYPFQNFRSYWVCHSILAGAVKALRKGSPAASEQPQASPTLSSSETRDVDWVMGAALLLSREAWESVGGFSPAYFLYAEDTDLCWRLQQAGYRVAFTPEVALTHTQGNPSPETRDLAMVRLFRGLQTFITRNYPPVRRRSVSAAVILDMLLRLALFTPQMLLRPRNPLPRKRVKGSLKVLKAYMGFGRL